MELKIYNPTEDGFIKAIEWNNEEIKKEITEKVAYYKTLVYTDDQIKDAKADRATLNKFITALEDKRKEIKKQCLEPYEVFEKQMKEIVSIINEPVILIDKQVKEYEEKVKQDKLESIKEIFGKYDFGDITFEQIFDSKWLNASVAIKAVDEAIKARLEQIKNDLDTLSNLPEFAFEAIDAYKSTLDMGKAINEGKRLSDIAKRKAEAERIAKEQAEASKQVVEEDEEVVDMPFNDVEIFTEEAKQEVKQEVKEWVAFKCLLSQDDAVALGKFFDDRNIKFTQI